MEEGSIEALMRSASSLELASESPSRTRREIGVRITVWGWSDAQLDIESQLLSHIRGVVAEGYFYGSEIAEIEEDVLANSDGWFGNADLSMDENGEFQLLLMPEGMDDLEDDSL